jgi:poly(3-hydroxybutyrate) depolymerase
VRRHLLTLTATAVALLASSGVASATTLPDAFTGACPTYGDMQVCSGSVPSFDGSKLDVDLTLPSGGGTSHPLIVMLHGFGNN